MGRWFYEHIISIIHRIKLPTYNFLTNWSLAVETIRMTQKFYTLIFFFITSLLAFAIVYFSGILFEKFENRYGFLLYLHHEEAHFQSEHFFLDFFEIFETPIAKANNQTLFYILLICLKFCYPCSLFYIKHSCIVTCILKQTTYGWSVPSVLVVTVIVIWISISLTQEERWGHDWCQKHLSSSLPSVIWSNLFSGILVKAAAPFLYRHAHTEHAHIIMCKKRSVTTPHCVLGASLWLSLW